MKKIDKFTSKIKTTCIVTGLLLAPFVVLVGCTENPGTTQVASSEHAHDHGEGGSVFALCHKCGEVVGTDKCCNKEGRTKCEKCGLFEGSPGCCKLNGATANVALCKKCGEIKGTDKCCKEEGRTKCGKCGLLEGSPGCCKLPKAKDEHSHNHSDTSGVFAICHKCGEVVGTGKCCKKEGRTKW